MYVNGCVSECLDNAIVVRRFWTVEKDVSDLTSSVRDNDIIRLGAVLRRICQTSCPSPTTTLDSRGQLNEGVVFGELRVLLFGLVMCMGVWEWMCK